MNGRITKIKFSPKLLEVAFDEKEAKSEKEVVYRSKEAPHGDFVEAIVRMAEKVRAVLDIHPDGWASLKVTGVSFSFSEETKLEGAVITAQVALSGFANPLVVNTPHASFAELDPAVVAELRRIRVEAGLFVEGKRLQEELVAKAS